MIVAGLQRVGAAKNQNPYQILAEKLNVRDHEPGAWHFPSKKCRCRGPTQVFKKILYANQIRIL